MRRTVLAISIAALSLVGLPGNSSAQETKSARGTITTMAANTMTVKVAEREMKFTLDDKTEVIATGGSTATRAATAAGKAGPKLTELLKVGEAVEISYHEMGATLHAARIRKITSAGSGGGSTTTTEEKSMQQSGTVSAVSGRSLTITGPNPGGGTFTATFTIDAETKVVAEGAGTASAKAGGKITITDVVGTGDQVLVTSHKMGDSMHASEVRVRFKAK